MKKHIYQIQEINLKQNREKLEFLVFDSNNKPFKIEVKIYGFAVTFKDFEKYFFERYIGYELDFTYLFKSSEKLSESNERILIVIQNEEELVGLGLKKECGKSKLVETNNVLYFIENSVLHLPIKNAKNYYNNLYREIINKGKKSLSPYDRYIIFNIQDYNDLDFTDKLFLEEIAINGSEHRIYLSPIVDTSRIEDDYVLEDYLPQDIISIIEEKVVIETNINKIEN